MVKTYNICWSGGLDSSMIVTQLVSSPPPTCSIRISPFYIKGQTFRLSEPQELAAIQSIRELLLADPRTKVEILPVTVIEKDDPRIRDREVVNAHRRIYTRLLEEYKLKNDGKLPPAGSQQIYVERTFISPQYIACGSLAKSLGENVEIGLLSDDVVHYDWLSYDLLENVVDTVTKREIARISPQFADRDLALLFNGVEFPLIGQKMFKKDVWRWYAEHDYLEVRATTHFCQSPFVNSDGTYEPCGVCTSCIGTIREGVLEPFPESALERYRDYEKNHEKAPERFQLKGF